MKIFKKAQRLDNFKCFIHGHNKQSCTTDNVVLSTINRTPMMYAAALRAMFTDNTVYNIHVYKNLLNSFAHFSVHRIIIPVLQLEYMPFVLQFL